MNDLTFNQWEIMSTGEQEAFARQLVDTLPDGFQFRALQTYSLADQYHTIAEFDYRGATFVLIPGTTVTLGYDPEQPWQPNAEEHENWRETAEEYEIPYTLAEEIERITLRPRIVPIKPLLVETKAGEIGWQEVSADSPEVQKVKKESLSQKSGAYTVQSYSGGSHLRVQRHSDGTITAQREQQQTHAGLVAEWAKSGFRLPTSDEWEYLCGAGATTFFRWGDHVPCDRYPTDVSPAEAAWRHEWVLSHGKLEYPPEGFVSDWEYHRAPNAFGLYIASDPYKNEVVAEPGITRGGDGGSTVCGGAGFLVGWLPLATAYYAAEGSDYNPEAPLQAGYAIARRVLSLE